MILLSINHDVFLYEIKGRIDWNQEVILASDRVELQIKMPVTTPAVERNGNDTALETDHNFL